MWLMPTIIAILVIATLVAWYVLNKTNDSPSSGGSKKRKPSATPKQHKKHSSGALYNLAAKGDDEAVAALLDKGYRDINERSPEGKTPLHYAVQRAHENVVALLLAHGADVNAFDAKHETPLHLTCGATNSRKTRDRYWRIAESLLNKGAYVNAKMDHGSSALFVAVRNARHDIVELLLEHGADPNTTDKEGYRPLFWAKRSENLDTIRRLEEAGAKESTDV